ncbi:MAG: multiheme c-type cytochrome [Methylobacter sp.]
MFQKTSQARERLLQLFSVFLLIAFVSGANAEIPAEPRQAIDMHLGVVTCAGNTCHGANAPLKNSRVQQNEFTIWHREDKHAKAYTVLFNDASKRIARNLGINAAHTEKLCLDCHADNIPVERRGKRFQIEDGVGCETCHGGGERYLGPHVSGTRTHAENVELGLYPTDQPEARATLCLACHLGTKDKLATHRILGAGHPRISFELDTFTHIEPMHFKLDTDYKERKGNPNGMQIWAVGQISAAERLLDLFQDPKYQSEGILPELAFFDCHACHRPMKHPHWTFRESSGLQPGSIHLNDANLLMLRSLLRHISPAQGEHLHKAILYLHQAASVSLADARKEAAAMRPLLADIRKTVMQRQFGTADMHAVAADLAQEGMRATYNDYGAAEQAAMALGAIAEALQTGGGLSAEKSAQMDGALKEIDAVLKDEHGYDPERMTKTLKNIETILR